MEAGWQGLEISTQAEPTTTLEQALAYARDGFSVIPGHSINGDRCTCGDRTCSAPGKHPRLRWRAHTKTALTEEELKSWWRRFPDSNVIIVTGKISGIAVLDIDGEEGAEAMAEIGLDVGDLPETPTVRTGGGGWHFYFAYPEDQVVQTKAGVLDHVDIRAEGGIVVAPPSMHISGSNYVWADGLGWDDVDIEDFDWSQLVKEGQPSLDAGLPTGDLSWFEAFLGGVTEGSRNVAATRLAGRYIGLGMSRREVLQLLQAWNTLNDPPLANRDIEVVVASISKREAEISNAETPELLDRISDILKMEVTSIQRISGDSPQIIIGFGDGARCTLTTAQVLSPAMFQKAIAEATKMVIRKLSSKTSPTHDRLAQLILGASEDIDAGVEATGEGEITSLLRDYLANSRMPELADDDKTPATGPFQRQGRLWFSLADLVQRAQTKWGLRIILREAAQRLRAIDAVHEDKRTSTGQRTVWGIKPSEIRLMINREDEDDD